MSKGLAVKVHQKWQATLDKERDDLRCDSRAECLDKILGSYFERKGDHAVTAQPEERDPAPAEESPKTLEGGTIYVIS